MNSDRFYKIVIVLLFVLNAGTLAFLFTRGEHGRPPRPPHRPDEIIIKRLNLDEKQIVEFQKLKEEHHSAMEKIDFENKTLHDNYFGLLKKEPVDRTAADLVQKEMGLLNAKKDSLTFDHFAKLKNLCNEKQKKLFNGLIDELSKMLAHPPPPPGAPHPPGSYEEI